MAQYTSTVSEVHVLRQAVKNTSSSIELLREAVSNSVDAGASTIDIKLSNVGGDVWNIVILDDGSGMEETRMKAFFNAGESVKDSGKPTIGEKGLGSKTTFVAKKVVVHSRRAGAEKVLVAEMVDPMASLDAGTMPTFELSDEDPDSAPELGDHGSRISLSSVHISKFNGEHSSDANKIAERVFHYLRSMCATGTVKNRHAHKQHILTDVVNVGTIPQLTLEVSTAQDTVTLGPESGSYKLPAANVAPTGGPVTEGISENSKKFCDTYDFSGVRTISIEGFTTTVHYDGTAIIAGEEVRTEMLKGELKPGWTHKSQMGVHLCKDFIPMRSRADLSRELLGGEFFYEYKVFLNCQNFSLNADRSVITNEESDEISWIWDDFKSNVWPTIQAKAKPYNEMKDAESAAFDAAKKTAQAEALKDAYSAATDIAVSKSGTSLQFVKVPKREADVSHLLAMMVQSGAWSAELAPIARFGQYIDASTDTLVENDAGDPLLVEIEMRLPNLFKHRHPMNSYDVVVVWDLGGLAAQSVNPAPWGSNGSIVQVQLLNPNNGKDWQLKWGTLVKKVIVLSEII